MFRPTRNILLRVEGIADIVLDGCVRHELHQAQRTGSRDGSRVEIGFRLDDGTDQGRMEPVELRRLCDCAIKIFHADRRMGGRRGGEVDALIAGIGWDIRERNHSMPIDILIHL